jgi:hypothetical protein
MQRNELAMNVPVAPVRKKLVLEPDIWGKGGCLYDLEAEDKARSMTPYDDVVGKPRHC